MPNFEPAIFTPPSATLAACQAAPPPRRARWAGRRRLAAMASVLLLIGSSAAVARPVTPATQTACEAAGGRWVAAGLQGTAQCDVRTADAGAPCREDSDCQSACVTGDGVAADTPVTGRCYERSLTLGHCLNYVTGGVATGVLCKD